MVLLLDVVMIVRVGLSMRVVFVLSRLLMNPPDVIKLFTLMVNLADRARMVQVSLVMGKVIVKIGL